MKGAKFTFVADIGYRPDAGVFWDLFGTTPRVVEIHFPETPSPAPWHYGSWDARSRAEKGEITPGEAQRIIDRARLLRYRDRVRNRERQGRGRVNE